MGTKKGGVLLTENCDTISHNTEESSRLRSQKKAERMRMMILTGSEAMVKRNRDSAGP